MSGRTHRTTAQPAETFVLEMDFYRRLARGEKISQANSIVKAYLYSSDSIGAEVPAVIVGTPTVSGTKLQQKTTWQSGVVGGEYLISFRAKVGSGEFNNVYEDDILVTVTD